tara:strand:+ start:410 stop:607 length:198 start_codon:yes stop_codon:yes gene_type:complete
MSLRAFHIIFVSISCLLMLFMLYWSFMNWNYYKDNAYLSYSGISFLGLVFLSVYARKFIKKYKTI